MARPFSFRLRLEAATMARPFSFRLRLEAAPMARPFVVSVEARAPVSGLGANRGAVHHAGRLTRAGEREIAQRNRVLQDIADRRDKGVVDLAVDQIGVADLK